EAEDVLLVPNAALRFRPDPGRIASPASEAAGGQPDAATGTVRNGGPGRGRGEARQSGSGRMRTVLWRLLPDGRLSALPVRVGISDGVHTEVAGDDLAAGLEVVLGTSGVGTPDAGSGSPFGGGASGGGRGGGGGPRRMPAVL